MKNCKTNSTLIGKITNLPELSDFEFRKKSNISRNIVNIKEYSMVLYTFSERKRNLAV